MNEKLKTEHAKLDPGEALRSSPTILLGVSAAAAAALKLVEIESIFDLATSRLFANASQLLSAGLDPKNTYYRFGMPPKDVVNANADGHRVDELRFDSIAILDGLDATNAQTLARSLDVKTVRDLALWPPYLAARQILSDTYLPELKADFDPEAPADLLPKSGEYPTERVFYHTLVLDQVDSEPDRELEEAGPIDIAPTLDQSFGFKNLGIGALLTISQSWYAQGVALGQLLHSTALAPGESTRIAMMDWSRRTKAGSTETISEQEQLDNETMHSRSLSEVTKAVANEAQEGFSSTNNTTTAHQSGKSSGSATINADPLNALTLGLFGDDPGVTTGGTTESNSTVNTGGMTFTSSSGNRSLEASTTQKVMDRTQQHANSVRNRRASIIREVSQEEHQSVSTRVVTNYNHMHALSIQYYEVVQIYRVEVGISDVEKCIFIPMKLVDFTQSVVDKYRLVLARAAQDRNARELLTTRYGVVEIMPQTPRITPGKLQDKLAKLQVATAVARDHLFLLATDTKPSPDAPAAPKVSEPLAAKATVNVRPSIVDVLAAKGYDLAQIDYAAKVIGKGVVRLNSDSLFLPDDTVITGLIVRDGVVTVKQAKVRGENTIISIASDGVSLTQSLPITEIESILLISGKEEEQTITLVLQCNYLGVVFPLSVKVRLAGGAGTQEVIRFGSVRASKDIIDHLNANKLHYSQAIYRSLDASSLALLLSPYSYKGKPLVQLIDPTPVTITGNYLVFKMHEEESETNPQGEDVPSEWGQWLKDHGISKSRVKTDLTPLPSGGVFAEAVLGRYNSAEKLDMTRFWNWQDSPIPITAPEIAPIEMTSRGATDDLKPGHLGAPVVSIVNPTALPDPTGMAAVLQAIQNGNMFRDMSGLAATMSLAQAGINAASQGATAAGAQAGSNAATAAQLLSDLAKTAASVMTMGAGGALGGAAGGLLSSGGGSGGGGNISNAGALMNQGRSLAERGAGSTPSGAGGSGGGQAGVTRGGGSTANNGSGPSGGGASPANNGGSADLETQAFNRALWGQAGESQSEMLRGLLQPISRLGFAVNDAGAGDAGGTSGPPLIHAPQISAAIANFKSTFSANPKLLTAGQFHITQLVREEMVKAVNADLTAKPDAELQSIWIDMLNGTHGRDIISKDLINKINGRGIVVDYPNIVKVYGPDPTATKAWAQGLYGQFWSGDTVNASPSVIPATLARERAAFDLGGIDLNGQPTGEKGACHNSTHALGRKYIKAKGLAPIPANLKISQGQIAGATIAAGPGALDRIVYSSPQALKKVVDAIKLALDAGYPVVCGLLSGVRHDMTAFPTPEHYVLVFAYDNNVFAFWDSDASVSNMTATGWGPGFGILVATTENFSTGFDGADLSAVGGDGNHLHFPKRHRYQVYYAQTLPL